MNDKSSYIRDRILSTEFDHKCRRKPTSMRSISTTPTKRRVSISKHCHLNIHIFFFSKYGNDCICRKWQLRIHCCLISTNGSCLNFLKWWEIFPFINVFLPYRDLSIPYSNRVMRRRTIPMTYIVRHSFHLPEIWDKFRVQNRVSNRIRQFDWDFRIPSDWRQRYDHRVSIDNAKIHHQP